MISDAAVMSKRSCRTCPLAGPPNPMTTSRNERSFKSTTRGQNTRLVSMLHVFPCLIWLSISDERRLCAEVTAWRRSSKQPRQARTGVPLCKSIASRSPPSWATSRAPSESCQQLCSDCREAKLPPPPALAPTPTPRRPRAPQRRKGGRRNLRTPETHETPRNPAGQERNLRGGGGAWGPQVIPVLN